MVSVYSVPYIWYHSILASSTDKYWCGTFTVPGSPPDNVSAEVQSSTSVLVTWEDIPLIDQNGVIMIYEVLYEPLETFNGTITEQKINTTNHFITLTDLEEFINYSISVRGFTVVGPGNYSVPLLVMTIEDGKFNIITKYNNYCKVIIDKLNVHEKIIDII